MRLWSEKSTKKREKKLEKNILSKRFGLIRINLVFPSFRDSYTFLPKNYSRVGKVKYYIAKKYKKKKYLPLNPFPLKFSLICGICKISDFYQRSFLFRSIYIIASTDFPKQRSICFETFSPQFHFLLSPARDNRKVHRLSNSRGHGMRAKRLQRTTFVSSALAYHANEVSNT